MFDMGGVVARHNDKEMEKEILSYLGVRDKDCFSQCDKTLSHYVDLMSSLTISEEQFWNIFQQKTGISVTLMHGESLWGKFFHPTIDEKVVSIINELKQNDMRVVLASNTEPPHKEYHERMGHYKVFDHVYTSCDLGVVKPEQEFFRKILKQENVQAEETFFVDDMIENCRAASKLGIKTYQFTTSKCLEKILKQEKLI